GDALRHGLARNDAVAAVNFWVPGEHILTELHLLGLIQVADLLARRNAGAVVASTTSTARHRERHCCGQCNRSHRISSGLILFASSWGSRILREGVAHVKYRT